MPTGLGVRWPDADEIASGIVCTTLSDHISASKQYAGAPQDHNYLLMMRTPRQAPPSLQRRPRSDFIAGINNSICNIVSR